MTPTEVHHFLISYIYDQFETLFLVLDGAAIKELPHSWPVIQVRISFVHRSDLSDELSPEFPVLSACLFCMRHQLDSANSTQFNSSSVQTLN